MDEGYDAVDAARARDLIAGRPLGRSPTWPARRRRDQPAHEPHPGRSTRADRTGRPPGAGRRRPVRRAAGPRDLGRRPGSRHARPAGGWCTTVRSRCSGHRRRSGSSTTARSTTTCCRRPRSCRVANPTLVVGRDRARRGRRGRRDLVARPVDRRVRSRASSPALVMALSASAIDESTFIWNPNLIALSSAVTLAAAWRRRTTGHAAWWLLSRVRAPGHDAMSRPGDRPAAPDRRVLGARPGG